MSIKLMRVPTVLVSYVRDHKLITTGAMKLFATTRQAAARTSSVPSGSVADVTRAQNRAVASIRPLYGGDLGGCL